MEKRPETRAFLQKASQIDPLTERIGAIGKYQVLIGLVYGLTLGHLAWQNFGNKFFSYPVQYSCPALQDETSLIDPCDPLACNGSVIFDESEFRHSIVSRWNLICDYDHYPRLAQTITFVGNLFGALISGHIADTYGRKTLICLGTLLLGIFGTLGPLAPNFITWTALRFLTGVTTTSVNVGANVYFIEIVDGKWRSICSALFGGISLQLGILSLGLLVYLIPSMITAEYIIGASAFPVCFLWFFVPESPRWYLSMGKLQKANTAIKNIAKFNGIHFEEISSSSISSRENPRNSTKSIMDLFRYPGIRRNFIIMCLNWFGFTMGYYGLVYNTPTYDFNIYLVFVFPTFFAIPLNFVIPLIENHIGRKPLLTGSMILSGVALLVSLTLVGHNWPVTMCSIFGTVVSFAAMSSGYIFCKELFPTVLRTTALSFATVAARLGSILSPIVGSLDRIHPALPIGVYGLVSLTGGILSIWLWPETKNIRLPDTLGECEAAASTTNPWCKKCSKGHQPSED